MKINLLFINLKNMIKMKHLFQVVFKPSLAIVYAMALVMMCSVADTVSAKTKKRPIAGSLDNLNG